MANVNKWYKSELGMTGYQLLLFLDFGSASAIFRFGFFLCWSGNRCNTIRLSSKNTCGGILSTFSSTSIKSSFCNTSSANKISTQSVFTFSSAAGQRSSMICRISPSSSLWMRNSFSQKLICSSAVGSLQRHFKIARGNRPNQHTPFGFNVFQDTC